MLAIQHTTTFPDGVAFNYECSCGTSSSDIDVGTSATLKLCKACYLKLNMLLGDANSAGSMDGYNGIVDDDC